MGKKKASRVAAAKPRSFNGVLRGRSAEVKRIAQRLRELVLEVLPESHESYFGGQMPMAMYRTTADVCWIQPLKAACNIYFMQGSELADPNGILQGKSDCYRYAKLKKLADAELFPIRQWLAEVEELNHAAVDNAMSFDEVLERLRSVCLDLPQTKETMTWGKPHFRVKEKIFCGCGEHQGTPRIGLKMEPYQSQVMMKLDGIEKAPYSRPGDGWVSIDPNRFDDWDEIEDCVVGSFRMIAPKRIAALLDD